MSVPIIVYHHGLFFIGEPPEFLPSSLDIAAEQMDAMHTSGLADAASEIHIGINGGEESRELCELIFPTKAEIMYHGLKSRNENLTIVALWEQARKIQGEAWMFYEHQKGSSHAPGSYYGDKVAGPWRVGMMQDLVLGWRECVKELEAGHDIVCSHFMWRMADGTQHIPAGNWLWIRASFARQLPSIYLRDRIKKDGIKSLSSRYEGEVFWGNGPTPRVKSFRPNGGGGVP